MRRERETVCPGNEHRKKTTSAQRFNSNYYFISGFLTVIFRMCCASPNHMRLPQPMCTYWVRLCHCVIKWSSNAHAQRIEQMLSFWTSAHTLDRIEFLTFFFWFRRRETRWRENIMDRLFRIPNRAIIITLPLLCDMVRIDSETATDRITHTEWDHIQLNLCRTTD